MSVFTRSVLIVSDRKLIMTSSSVLFLVHRTPVWSIQCGLMAIILSTHLEGVLQEQLYIWDRWILAMLIFIIYYLV